MITKENYSEEHIRELQNQNNRDPILIERALFALGLLEALVKVGLPFTFKGGTGLLLLLPKPMRLSTDYVYNIEGSIIGSIKLKTKMQLIRY